MLFYSIQIYTEYVVKLEPWIVSWTVYHLGIYVNNFSISSFTYAISDRDAHMENFK